MLTSINRISTKTKPRKIIKGVDMHSIIQIDNDGLNDIGEKHFIDLIFVF